jgi:hypothetical protein
VSIIYKSIVDKNQLNIILSKIARATLRVDPGERDYERSVFGRVFVSFGVHLSMQSFDFRSLYIRKYLCRVLLYA